MKFSGGTGHGPTNQLDFGGDPENDPYAGFPDSGIFKRFSDEFLEGAWHKKQWIRCGDPRRDPDPDFLGADCDPNPIIF